jgi:hypothetical protein
MSSSEIDRTVVCKIKIDDAPSDLTYWRSQSYEKRLAALESIRTDYNKWKYGAQPGLQRVYRVIKQS